MQLDPACSFSSLLPQRNFHFIGKQHRFSKAELSNDLREEHPLKAWAKRNGKSLESDWTIHDLHTT